MSRQTKPSASGRDRVEALSFANAEKWQKQWSCDSNLMRLRWIPIILAIGFTLSILGGGNFFSQNRTDRIIAICVSIFGLAAIICAVWVLRSYL